jgi:hypothetical protein
MNTLKASLLGLLLALATTAHAQFQFSENNGTLTVTGYSGPDTVITIPSTNTAGELVTSIGASAFQGSSLASVTIPDSITNIGTGAFLMCGSLTNITIIGHGLVSINLGAFIYCTALATITLPDSVTALGDSVFLNSGLTTITLPGNLTTTGNSTLSGCTNLARAIIAPGIINCGGGCFKDCIALTNVSIPDGVTNLGGSAFINCISLTNLTLPASVTNIGTSAFSGCTNLAGLYFKGDAPTAPASAFGSGSNTLSAVCYYLPNTTGWASTLGGLPTRLWDPQMQTQYGVFGMHTNEFGFNITASTNLTVVVQACTDLLNGNWRPVQTVTLTNAAAYFSDPQWTNYPGRFYRISSP